MEKGVLEFRKNVGEADRKRNEATVHPAGITCLSDISYGPHGKWNTLNVYFPDGTEKALPVIVSIHGGGYIYGTKEVYHHYCADLARRGFAVINFNYRLAPETRFPGQLEDINAVFRWLCINGSAYHTDMNKLFVVGDSAGAQMASQYAAILTNGEYAGLFGFVPAQVRIRAIGLNCGMYDMYAKVANKDFGLAEHYLGKDLDLSDPRLDVLGAINGQYPPAHITTAWYDFNRDSAQFMADYLTERGLTAQYKCYGTPEQEHIGHVFHVDIRLPEATECNDAQCAFFRQY